MVAKAIRPDYGLSSHVAALGVTFSQGETLSPRFANGAFVGEHGSWDRSPLNGYQVIFVPFVNGRPSGAPIPVVTDFLASDHQTVRGRPVGVALDRTGALLDSGRRRQRGLASERNAGSLAPTRHSGRPSLEQLGGEPAPPLLLL